MKLPYFTTDELIKAIKRNNLIPTHQKTFQDEDFIAFLNEEMSLGLVPTVIKMKENYLLTTVNVPLQVGVTQYEIPARAVGNKTREVAYIDTNGNVCEMTCIQKGDLPFYNEVSDYTEVYVYYIENNIINIVSNVTANLGSLAISYYMRPNQLVLLEDVGIIENIDRVSGRIYLDKIPDDFSTGESYDLIQHTSPHKCLDIDLSVTGIDTNSNFVTMDVDDIPTNLQIGDHFCIAQQAAIPQIPSDLHAILAHRAGKRCMAALGDNEAYAVASNTLAEFEKNTENLISDRVEDSPKRIINRRSIMRGGISSRRGRYRG